MKPLVMIPVTSAPPCLRVDLVPCPPSPPFTAIGSMTLKRFFSIPILLCVSIAALAANEHVISAQSAASAPPIQERLNRVRADLFSAAPHVADDVKELKEILGAEPRSVEAHVLLGMAYRALGTQEMLAEAVAEFRQTIELDASFVPARFYLAHVYLDLGRASRAKEELLAALEKAPGNPQFTALLGEAERQLKNPAKAVELLRQALQADASLVEAHYYLGLALFDAGQTTGVDQGAGARRPVRRREARSVSRPWNGLHRGRTPGRCRGGTHAGSQTRSRGRGVADSARAGVPVEGPVGQSRTGAHPRAGRSQTAHSPRQLPSISSWSSICIPSRA